MTAQATSGRLSEALATVESQLQALWTPTEGEPPKVRATTLNLVVLTGSEISAASQSMLDALGATHPARTLVLTVNPRSAPWTLDGNVHAICRKDPGGEILCSERIELVLGAATVKRVASVTSALLVPELETTVLVLPNAPMILADELTPKADRCIVDTRVMPLTSAARIAGRAPGHLEDLGFILAFPWRELTARFFDQEGMLPLLAGLTSVELAYAPAPDGSTPADVRLHLGWLASRLGWVVSGPDRAVGPSGPITIATQKVAAQGDGSLGALYGMTLRGRLGDAEAQLSVSRDEDTCLVWSFQIGSGAATVRKHHLLRRDELWLVSRAIDSTAKDHVLREALASAAALPA